MTFSGWLKDISHWPIEVRRWLSDGADSGSDASAALADVARSWENLRDSVDAARGQGVAWREIAAAIGVGERTIRSAMATA
jgi:hypothetical protein